MPEFGTPHPARDYPSAPSVDLKHDRGNCAVGDVRDRWKESESGRGHYLNRGGHSLFRLCLNLETGQKGREKSFFLLYGCSVSVCVDLNEESLVSF